MNGKDMGSLNVYSNISNTSSLLWTQFGNKGDVWFNGQIPIISAKSFRVVIEAVRGKDYTSDVAIGNVSNFFNFLWIF